MLHVENMVISQKVYADVKSGMIPKSVVCKHRSLIFLESA